MLKQPFSIPQFLKIRSKQGAAPGTLTHIGEKKVSEVHVSGCQYSQESHRVFDNLSLKDLTSLDTSSGVTWLNIDGLHDTELVKKVGSIFGMHSLLLEDVLNTGHRPKMEEFEDCLFFVLKMLHVDDNMQIEPEQMTIILKKNLVISFQEQPEHVLDPIRERIDKDKGKIRSFGADYLAYRLFDAVVDEYFLVLEQLGERIEHIEQQLITKPDDSLISSIYAMRQQLLFVRKAVYPLRDVVSRLQHGEPVLIENDTIVFLRDLYDHTIQVVDAVETYRDLLGNMLDNYLSLMSHRMNNVMKTLTIVGSIFIPLTFIAGVYGMNFQHMPELSWSWGYPLVWLVMIIVGIGMAMWFKSRKWL